MSCDAGRVCIASFTLQSSIKKSMPIAESPQPPIAPLEIFDINLLYQLHSSCKAFNDTDTDSHRTYFITELDIDWVNYLSNVTNIEEMWNKFKSKLNAATDKSVPTRMIGNSNYCRKKTNENEQETMDKDKEKTEIMDNNEILEEKSEHN
ncbi:hypothetical protein E2C01_031951 [Portunus trituberculatus]|uniref:Uncharacterized protein n=1 Tax=Portunus trituberculatus TaxID=210409 RepID=A0A5B7F1H1_PORTR|nr:hypothetical protein [Portunus trituberculatus]